MRLHYPSEEWLLHAVIQMGKGVGYCGSYDVHNGNNSGKTAHRLVYAPVVRPSGVDQRCLTRPHDSSSTRDSPRLTTEITSR